MKKWEVMDKTFFVISDEQPSFWEKTATIPLYVIRNWDTGELRFYSKIFLGIDGITREVNRLNSLTPQSISKGDK